MPELSARAGALYDRMDFGFYYRPDVNRILFHYVPAHRQAGCCYDTIVSESRIASYIGIAKGEIPRGTTSARWRSFPDSCDWTGRRHGRRRRPDLLRRRRFEGAYPYSGTRVTPELGRQHVRGADAAAVRPRGALGSRQLAANHPLTVEAQIDHGLVRQATATGASRRRTCLRAATTPGEWTPSGWIRTAYPSNEDTTLVDGGFPGCPGGSRCPTRRRARTRTAW